MKANKIHPISFETFALGGDRNLLDPQDLGIINGKITTGIAYRDVLSMHGLFAPPYSSPDFRLDARLFGEKVRTDRYRWYPHKVERHGQIEGLRVDSILSTAVNQRAIHLRFTIHNATDQSIDVPIQFAIEGGLEYETQWRFAKPDFTWPAQKQIDTNVVTLHNHAGSISIATNVPDLACETCSGYWNAMLKISSHASHEIRLVVVLADCDNSSESATQLIVDANPVFAMDQWVTEQVRDIYDKLPSFQASDQRLELLYTRSLVHLILNRWDVPEFKLNPYYSTGGINGGCVGSYLWDLGECWELLPLFDPEAIREHIKSFLSIDLTRHFAITPMSGEGFGPHYPVNQEKITFLIYHYITLTGDNDFLHEDISGKTVWQHALNQALYRDNIQKPVDLIDYGIGNNHLELRTHHVYNHIMPDLNGRRYAIYNAVADLCDLAGAEAPVDLRRRAEQLKSLLNGSLWDSKLRWYRFMDETGACDYRYTIQMFKLIGSSVLDFEQEVGLLSHLNDAEFLSEYGLHSMSKLDMAYDQVDIDNGGGGNCVCFPPQIIERLYRAGQTEHAEEILRRILWWSDRFPYWGDSIVANQKDYRRDTPLQNAIGSLAVAQSLIFGMFGVRVEINGDIHINPSPPSFSPRLSLTNLRLRGRAISINVEGSEYEVFVDGDRFVTQIGVPTLISGCLTQNSVAHAC